MNNIFVLEFGKFYFKELIIL